MIYADNAATTRLDEKAFEAMKTFLLNDYSNPSQPYSFARESKKELKTSREIIAKIIGADEDEIFFTSCGTESDNWAIKMGAIEGGDIVTSAVEHHAIINTCIAMEKMGRKVTYIPVDNQGIIELDSLENSITDNTKIVSVMFANNEIGTIEPIEEVAIIAHKHGCIVHTDAVQAVGHVPIDVHKMGIDMLSASGHKFNGPKGIGFIYIKKGLQLLPYMDGGAQEKGRRAGTENVASIVGMATALENNYNEMSAIGKKLNLLEKQLLDGLRTEKIDFIHNGASNHIPGNLSLSFRNCKGEMILHRLDLMGICVSTGSACDSQETQLSHVLKAINLSEDYAYGTIRVSLGKDNTEDDIIKIVKAIKKIIG